MLSPLPLAHPLRRANSPLSLSTVGHPGWRNDPPYLAIREGQALLVTNQGGRGHTFTWVAQFGGGRVPPLSVGLTIAPECASASTSPELHPGENARVTDLAPGVHRFQCCLHPWMRTVVDVDPR